MDAESNPISGAETIGASKTEVRFVRTVTCVDNDYDPDEFLLG